MLEVAQSSILKQTLTTEEIAARVVSKNWKEIMAKLSEKDQDRVYNDLVRTLDITLSKERENCDAFIEISKNDIGVVGYYLELLDKIKMMSCEALVCDSKKKRDILLLEMSKILGANVIEEGLPVKAKIAE
jgi:hypothetical protein